MAPKITTLLFDCDNTLVLSESLAFEACANLVNKILISKDIVGVTYTGEQLRSDFVGQNFRGMVSKLVEKYALNLSAEELETYVRYEEDEVIKKLEARLQACDGVTEVLKRLHASGTFKLAVVSSSCLRRVLVSLERVGLDRFFDTNTAVFSATTSLPKPTSKPDPAVYIWAMEKLGVSPMECLAIEDSPSGSLSAHRAGIKIVGYTGSYSSAEMEKMTPLLKESGAAIIMKKWSEFEGILEQLMAGDLE